MSIDIGNITTPKDSIVLFVNTHEPFKQFNKFIT